ncbi:MAG: ribosome-associated translation inhibitor RaiA [Bacillota bacterium]|nr:ribosome-associated translation inhibitor RaiA [Bacillota bacterium]
MRITYKGKNTEVTPALKEHAEKKLGRLERIMEVNDVTVSMIVERNRHKAEVNMVVNGYILRGEVVSDDMYSAIDLVTDKMEKQLVKYKEKLQRINKKQKVAMAVAQDDFAESDLVENLVVRTKRFPVKPMTVEEAVMQMDMLGHNFFVFTNSETEAVNVVYCRNDGKYGLLEPEF